MKCIYIDRINDQGVPIAYLVVEGKKVWDNRRRNTKFRGEVGVLFIDKVVGKVTITDVKGPYSPRYLARFEKYHRSNYRRMKKYARGRKLYVWVMKNAKKFKKPLRVISKFEPDDLVEVGVEV